MSTAARHTASEAIPGTLTSAAMPMVWSELRATPPELARSHALVPGER